MHYDIKAMYAYTLLSKEIIFLSENDYGGTKKEFRKT